MNNLKNLRNEKEAVHKMFIYWLDKHLKNYFEQLESILMFPANENEPTQLLKRPIAYKIYIKKHN